jgi:hypothetical protein
MTTTYDLDALAPISTRGAEVDLLASTLRHVLQGNTHHTHHSDRQDDKHTGIDLVVNSDVLTLKGNGAEVTPTLLTGHIVLDLAESTTVRQITLQFRGKAKLPPVENEPWVSFLLDATDVLNPISLASSVFYIGSVSVTRR